MNIKYWLKQIKTKILVLKSSGFFKVFFIILQAPEIFNLLVQKTVGSGEVNSERKKAKIFGKPVSNALKYN